MRLSDGSSIDDWLPKGSSKQGATSLLAGIAEFRAVLDALPNSREELEAIVSQARAVLDDLTARLDTAAGELTARISSHMVSAGASLSAAERKAHERIARALDEVADLRGEAELALGRVTEWQPPDPPDVTGFAERAALDALRQGLGGQVASVVGDLTVLREESRQALEAFKEKVDHRFKGVMTVAPPASAIKVKKSGTKVGERKAINFIPGSNVTLTVADNGSGEGQVDVTIAADAVVALTDGANIALDASLGNVFTVTLGGNRTLDNPTNPVNGQKIVVRVRQDATGSRTLAYGSAYRFGTDVVSPTLTTTAAKTDYLGFTYNSTDSKWDLVAVSKGY